MLEESAALEREKTVNFLLTLYGYHGPNHGQSFYRARQGIGQTLQQPTTHSFFKLFSLIFFLCRYRSANLTNLQN